MSSVSSCLSLRISAHFFLSERMHFPLCLCSLLVTVNFCYKRTLNALSLPPAVSHNTRSLTGQKRNLGWCERTLTPHICEDVWTKWQIQVERLQPHLQCLLYLKQRSNLFIWFYFLSAIAKDLRRRATQGRKVLAVPSCVPGCVWKDTDTSRMSPDTFQHHQQHWCLVSTCFVDQNQDCDYFIYLAFYFYFFGILPLNRERA